MHDRIGEARWPDRDGPRITTQDRRFLESLRIQVDQESMDRMRTRSRWRDSSDDATGRAVFKVAADCHRRYRMKKLLQIASASALLLGTMAVSRAAAQDPIVTAPIIASEVAPIIISAVKPKPKPTGLAKFEGTVLLANSVQITVKAMGNE